MSTPVVTDKWAGNLDCDFCRRKRLMGDEFSKKALEKYRREGGKLKCKQCVQQGEETERQAAAKRREAAAISSASAKNPSNDNIGSGTAPNSQPPETRKCAGDCNQQLDFTSYNRNQWNKGDGKSKCRACVDAAIAQEVAQQKEGQEDKLAAALQRVTMAQASGNALALGKAESELAALQAEQVTGLKPIKLGGRGGRAGRSGGRGGRLGRGR